MQTLILSVCVLEKLPGLAQAFQRPKAKFSNGTFILSIKSYLTNILYNNFFKIHSFYFLI